MKIEFIKNKNFRDWSPILLIFLFALFLRTIWIDRVPGAITGDEINYILPIKSVVVSGYDLTYHWNLLRALLFQYPTQLPQGELSYFLLYPASFFPLSLFSSTITFALISAATAVAIFLLVNQLFGRRAALASALIFAINPWQIFIGRTAYEMAAMPFFFLLAIYFLVREKGNRILLSLPFFILAFYSDIATKPILVPIVVVTSIFAFFENHKKYARQYITLNIACILLTAFFIFMISHGTNRLGELAKPSDPQIAQEVNGMRKNSLASSSLTNIFENKFTVYSKTMLLKTINSFTSDYLFISGDNFTGLYGHGLFYFIDGLFLILGLGFMLARQIRTFALVGSLILISTIPHVIHTVKLEIFSPHLALFMTFLVIPIGLGIAEVISLFKNRIAIVLITSVYAISLSNFLFVYFFQFPLEGQFDFPARIVSRYVSFAASKGSPVNVYANGTHDFYKKYIFYTDSLNRQNFDEIKNSTNTFKYRLGSVTFQPCGDIFKNFDVNAVSIFQSNLCSPFKSNPKTLNAKVARLDDGGEIYKIYNDKVCSDYSLKTYPSGLKISDFSVESLSSQKFCETFITR